MSPVRAKRFTMIHTDRYKTFLVCADCRSFTAAAKKIHYSPSTVSKHISKLEDELGFALFLRTPKGLVLTEKGLQCLPIIEKIVSASEQLLALGEEDK